MTATTINRLCPSPRPQLILAAIATLLTGPVLVASDEGCEILKGEVGFADANGSPIDASHVDAIAYRLVGDEVVVYERTRSDAAALVADLAASGESSPLFLDEKTWLVAQAANCRMRPNDTCSGACPGRQTCRRVKRPGKDICQCMVDPSPGPRPGPRALRANPAQ